jgi:surface antigen
MAKLTAKAAICLATTALLATSVPAAAQLGNLINRGTRGAQQADNCGKGKKGDKGRGVLGGIIGGAVGDLTRGIGLPSFVPVPSFSDQITASIACRLDPEEQEQAVNATLEATRGETDEDVPPLGSNASWTSNTRGNVSGTSIVTGRQPAVAGADDCITVTDVVIIEGEETRAEKRMCRRPGSPRYSIIA